MRKLFNITYCGLLCIFIFITGFSIFLGISQGNSMSSAYVLGIIIILVCFSIKPHLSKLASFSRCKLLTSLSILCFLTKLFWILKIQIAPAVDYETFYNYAVRLSQAWAAPDQYIELFPHIMGYSSFLSIFILIFGEHVLLAPFLNVIITVLSGILIFLITEKLISKEAAVGAYLLWILCPSQSLYNSLVLSEPLYTLGILFFMFILIEVDLMSEKSNCQYARAGLLAGAVLCAINSCRPIASILVLAMLLWLLLIKTDIRSNRTMLKKWIIFSLTSILLYVTLNFLWSLYMESRLGAEPARTIGFTFCAGMNVESKGSWNLEDSTLLSSFLAQPGATPRLAQEEMLEVAKQRILFGNIDFVELFTNKLNTFLGRDDAVVSYLDLVLPQEQHRIWISMLCNAFFAALMLSNLFTAIKFTHTKSQTVQMIMFLYIIGLTLAHMLVEVAGRYHYSVIPILIISSQYVLTYSNSCLDLNHI